MCSPSSNIVPPGLYVPRTPMLLGRSWSWLVPRHRRAKDYGKLSLLQQIRSQDRARYEGSRPGSKGCSAARPSDERFGDFVQHEVTMKISCSDQCQQQLSTISGNHGGVGMLVVQRHRLKARDEECSTTIRYHPRNEGLDDLCY